MPVKVSVGDCGSDEQLHDPITDFYRFECTNSWNLIYERLKNLCSYTHEHASTDASRQEENRWKNRYRNIIPFDSTRVILHSYSVGDYINANFVQVSAFPHRKYILTQGPLKQTISHFWQMVWENKSPLIVMLNKVVEKGNLKCHPYFPDNGQQTEGQSRRLLVLDDVDFQIRLEEEHRTNGDYINRIFKLIHSKTGECHTVIHMNYTVWPDFGVPSTPGSFLNFLWAVRNTELLSKPHAPAIVHCSAGVGRSGAFVLIDLALCLIEQRQSMNDLDLCKLLMELRTCRMGIIQTVEQFRFCYTAVIQGAEAILNCPTAEEVPFIKFESYSDEGEGVDEVSSEEGDDDDDDWDGTSLEDVESEDLIDQYCASVSRSTVSGVTFNIANRLAHLNLTNGPSSSSDRPIRAPNSWLSNANDSGPDGDDHYGFENNTFGMMRRRRFPRAPVNLNRSNNALLVNMAETSDMDLRNRLSEVTTTEAPSLPATLQSWSDSGSAPDLILTHPHGDGLSASNSLPIPDTQNPMDSDELSNAAEMESLATEYMAATYDLQRRRNVRRQRQVRLRERVDEIMARMREADLERRRWIPQSVLRYLRRLYSESGWVNNPTQAFVTTALIVCAAIGFTMWTYNYMSR